jgi:enoyl-CoA hydratase/carnithine racemase
MSNNETIDTGTDHLLAAQEAAVLTLTLNRPEVRNALSAPMLGALSRMLRHAETSPDVRVVVLTGSGAAFCAGGDLTMLARGESMFGPSDEPHSRLANQILIQRATVVRLHRLSKPTIAVLPGPAVGAGLGLALACDLRYGGPTTTLGTGFGRLGLAGDFGCTWLLRQIVVPSRALEFAIHGRGGPGAACAAPRPVDRRRGRRRPTRTRSADRLAARRRLARSIRGDEGTCRSGRWRRPGDVCRRGGAVARSFARY